MNKFNVWEVADSHEEAIHAISVRIDMMQKLYEEAILLAQEFDIRVTIDLELPEEAQGGHNQGMWGYWSASSAQC